jgi:hypothetical protein
MEKISEAIRLLAEAKEELEQIDTALVWKIKLTPDSGAIAARKFAECVSRRREKGAMILSGSGNPQKI